MPFANRPNRRAPLHTGRPAPVSSDRPTQARITQRTLETYLRLSEQAKALEKTRLALQRQLETLYASKVDVEPGPLDIERIEIQAKVFSPDKIAEVIGVQGTIELRNKLAPTVTSSIKVVDRSPAFATTTEPKRKSREEPKAGLFVL